MKKHLVFVMLCVLLFAITALPVSAQTAAVKVSTVDDLLSAIAPGTVIELENKDYDLTAASGYGTENGPYFRWVDCYDGFELQIENVDGLTIRAPEGARLLTGPRYANVLLFRNCRDITLEGLTAGHSPEQGSCSGGVIWLENCSKVTLDDCVLFGCGVTALTVCESDTVSVNNSSLTECSYSGAEIYRSEDVLFNGCTFSKNGEGEYCGAAVYTDSSRYVTAMNCVFTKNNLSFLLQANASREIALLGCQSYDNSFAFFFLEATDVTVVNCSFADMNMGNAFAAAYTSGRVLDLDGNSISFDALLLMKHVSVSERPARAVQRESELIQGASGQHYYEVSTADEFLSAIGSHRVLCLSCDINLSDASDYGMGWNEFRRWEEVYDGSQLVITGVKDLTITAKRPGVSLVTGPREANVLTFIACEDITVSGLTIGHTEMPEYSCTGAVLVFNGSRDIEIEDCALFGCGTIGVEASSCRDIEIEDTEIYDCTLGGIYFFAVSEADIEHCNIHDCAFPCLHISPECTDIEADGFAFFPGDYDSLCAY